MTGAMKERNLNDVHMTKGGLVTIFVAWEVMGGKATTNVVEMRDSDLDPIYNFDSVFPGATYCSFFFQSTLSCPTFALDTQLSSLLLLFLA